MAAVIDVRLKDGEAEHCIVIKDTVIDKVLPHVILDVQSDAVILNNNLIVVQRDDLGFYNEVISYDLASENAKLLHKCTNRLFRVGTKEVEVEAGSLR